ncbi:MAG: hypothetical protein ACKOJB_05835 [Chthoniobacterales bacterium]
MILAIPVFCLLLASAGSARALIQEAGMGIVYGKDHAFSLTAPKGWMLDNESGLEQGVYAAFYPKGRTWKDSHVVAYARSRPRNENISSVEDVVKDTVAIFHQEGNPNYKAEKVTTLTTPSGKEAVIYHFQGDKWGNKEAAAYFPENKTINFIVLNCRDERDFEVALGPFEELINSYMFMGDDPLGKKSETKERTGEP